MNSEFKDNICQFYQELAQKYYEGRLSNKSGLIFNNYIEVPAILDFVYSTHINAENKVLDIGCAFGYFTKIYASKGCKVTAIDTSSKMLQFAKEYNSQYLDRITFINNDFLETSLKEYYDIIIGSFMLGYFINLDTLFLKISQVCNENSSIIFSMLHPLVQNKFERTKDGYAIKSYFGGEYFESNFLGTGKTVKLKKWNFDQVSRACYSAGLYIDQIIEPTPIQGLKDFNIDLFEFYSNYPSVAIFIIRKKSAKI